MWDCPLCGCMGIAHDLEFCPMCFKPRPAPDPGTPTEELAGGTTAPDAGTVESDATDKLSKGGGK